MPGNPLPTDGTVGQLKPEQEEGLRNFWREFYELVDNAPEHGSAELPDGDNGGASGGDAKNDGKDAGKDIPKDDKAKEKMKAEQELRDAKAALEKYGRTRFMATCWRCMMMDDPDVLMMKFLRARKYNVAAGVAMFCAMMKWRMESDVEKIVAKGEEGMQDAEGFIKQMSSGKTYVQGTDREGRPVVYIHVKLHRLMDQSAKALEDFVIFSMEAVRSMLTPPLREKATIVFDMTGFGLANMDWKCILFIVKCLEAYYPESLNVMIIHNAPWVFQGIWKILSPMLDPVVRAKIQMTKNTDDLVQHIEKKHLIKQLGGESEWKWEYEPVVEGENAKQKDSKGKKRELAHREKMIREFDNVTRKWMKDGDPKQAKLRQYIMFSLRRHYFKLDPYLRGRSVYHRKGNIVGNGLVAWEYPGVTDGAPEGEWEVQGYNWCYENLGPMLKRLRVELEADGIEIPDLEPDEKASKGAEAAAEDADTFQEGKKPSTKKRRQSKGN